jgi:hypothetical protein
MKSPKIINVIMLIAKIASTLIAAFLLFMFLGETFGGPQSQTVSPKNVNIGSTYHLDLNDTIKGGIWHSANPLIADVDHTSGIVRGISPGTTTITHTFSSGETSYAVNIVKGPPKWKDALGLTLMAIIWIGMVIVWWKEALGAWLTVAGITIAVTFILAHNGSVHSLNLLF